MPAVSAFQRPTFLDLSGKLTLSLQHGPFANRALDHPVGAANTARVQHNSRRAIEEDDRSLLELEDPTTETQSNGHLGVPMDHDEIRIRWCLSSRHIVRKTQADVTPDKGRCFPEVFGLGGAVVRR